ncbi:cell division protein ZipA [Halomonas halmophila]|uniref:Cell division protein ZipA n=1 Tax=Halomonas halmophila TaxID=252 RepID=A0A4Y4ETA1_9GAMM|nr:cell division protein ZipA [Halomonas halmophila]GED21112.1 hypothetical protein HHA01_00890 [Halomonas halmophila]
MELREWLIILGLALVTLIVIDGVRRLQRQRQVPRLDRAGSEPANDEAADSEQDPDEAARQAELSWELPNGGARVVRPAEQSDVQSKPKLQRQDHPGPSRVLSEFRRQRHEDDAEVGVADEPAAAQTAFTARSADAGMAPSYASADMAGAGRPAAEPFAAHPGDASPGAAEQPAPTSADDEQRQAPLAADPSDHDAYQDEEERYRLVDLEGMGDSLKSGSRRMGSSVHRFGSSLQKSLSQRRARKEQERAERRKREEAEREEKARREREAAEARAAREAEPAPAPEAEPAPAAAMDHADDVDEADFEDDVVTTHPVLEKALRHDVTAEHARQTLSNADEVIVISVMSRDEEGFSGAALLDLMLACGLRYGRDMGIFHRFETADSESPLQFSMVNVVKPGTFPIHSMDDFATPGVTLLLPLPSTCDTSAAFEAMVETAMVVVRHLGGELKDENLSVMTAQTVEFARQRVQEFERRHRLSRYQVN